MTKAAVVGHPIAHSKSPVIHNYWIKAYGMEGSYEAVDIAPDNLKDGIQRLIDGGYAGFNVTVPHKEEVLKLCDEVAHNAEAIGAVNTVVIEDGKLRGMNTDSFGFLHNIWDTEPDFEFTDKIAVIIGAGGAARAVTSALISEQIGHVYILNRTRERAEIICKEMGFGIDLIKVFDWDERSEILAEADLLVNTTSLGMNGQPPLNLSLDKLSEDALVNDIVYAPLHTELLQTAQMRGNDFVSGIGMLIHQARPAFKEWFGLLPDVTEELTDMVSE